MKELDFLSIIKNTSNNNGIIGDDCAYLNDLGIFITQDTLVEDVHFSMHTTTPYLLGKKAVNVNLSDLAAALSKPEYISVSLSMPKTIKEDFVSELYRGINEVCNEYNIVLTGGDITGSDKVVISICALGKKIFNYITSRSFAKKGDYILTTGNYGSSGAGLYALSQFLYAPDNLITAHLSPKARIKEAMKAGSIIDCNIAAMDTSDGLIDALYKISEASAHTMELDLSKVPVSTELIHFSKVNNLDYKHFVKWGAEDYELILCVNENIYNKLDKNTFTCIGRVLNKDTKPCVIIKDSENIEYIKKGTFETNSFNHF